jgi:xylulokinase
MDPGDPSVISLGRLRYPANTFLQNSVDVKAIAKLFLKLTRNLSSQGVKYAGLSSMAPIMILADVNGEPVSAIPYNSLLGSEYIAEFNEEDFRKKTLNVPNVQMFQQKIMWFKHNNPNVLQKARSIMDLNSYLVSKYQEKPTAPVQDVNTALEWGLIDASKRDWDYEAAQSLAIDHMLPQLVTPEFTTSNKGMSVSLGTVDTLVSALGSVGMDQDKMFLSNGSTLCAGFISETPLETRHMYNDFFFDGKYLVNGCNSQFSTIIDWAERNFRKRINVNDVDMVPRNSIFLPYLEGERSPLFDTNIRGALFDLDKSSTNDDIIAAAVHSLSYISVDMIEHLKLMGDRLFTSVIAGGGLSKRNLASIISALTGLDYEITGVEPTTIGAILIAMRGNGLIKQYPRNTEEYGLRIEGRVHPNTNLLVHERNYKKFIKFREMLQNYYKN